MRYFSVLAILMCASLASASGVFTRSENDYIDLTDNAALTFTATEAGSVGWTLSFWVKLATLTGAGADDEHVLFSVTDGSNVFTLRVEESTFPSDKWLLDWAPPAVVDNTVAASTSWQHVCLVGSSDANHLTIKEYTNGNLAADPPFGWHGIGSSVLNPSSFRIGKLLAGGDVGLGGKLSQLAFWDRKLTDTEIDKLSGTNGETKTSATDLESPDTFKYFFPLLSNATDATGTITASNTGVTFDEDDDPFPVVTNIAHWWRRRH